jgi:hypothetical protein
MRDLVAEVGVSTVCRFGLFSSIPGLSSHGRVRM